MRSTIILLTRNRRGYETYDARVQWGDAVFVTLYSICLSVSNKLVSKFKLDAQLALLLVVKSCVVHPNAIIVFGDEKISASKSLFVSV